MCFVFIWEQTATCDTYSINWLVFITEMKSVYCAVRTGHLTKAVCASSLTLMLLTWTKWRAPTNASKWRMGFNSAFKGFMYYLSLVWDWSLSNPACKSACAVLYCRLCVCPTVPFFHIVSQTALFSGRKSLINVLCFDFLHNFCLKYFSF